MERDVAWVECEMILTGRRYFSIRAHLNCGYLFRSAVTVRFSVATHGYLFG